jgi:hypothetical protein
MQLDGGRDQLQISYYLLVLNMFFGLAASILCMVLLIKHVRLVNHNSTTWEEAKRDKIEYLKRVPKSVLYPFDEGTKENIKYLFRADRAHPREWRLPRM